MKKLILILNCAIAFTCANAQVVTKFSGTVQAGTPGSVLIGTGAAAVATAGYADPANLFVDAGGRMWIVESTGNRVRMVDNVATPVSVYHRAGSTQGNNGSNDGTGIGTTLFSAPNGVAVNASGSIYISDRDNNCIRKLAEFINVSSAQTLSTYAGKKGPQAGYTDATGLNAEFNQPADIAVDAAGNLYVADAGNNCIRKIEAGTGVVTTLAGNTTAGDVDGTGSAARFSYPTGLAWYSATELLVTDMNNLKIKKVDITTKVVVTIAGTGSNGTADGNALTEASFSSPNDVDVDANKNIYVTDGTSNTIRKISGTCVTTFAGTAGTAGSTDGIGSTALFNNPTGIFFNNGFLYICDQGNHVIRKMSAAATGQEPAPSPLFYAESTSGSIGTVIKLHDTTTTQVNSRVWSFTPNTITFKDGTDSTSAAPHVQFDANGFYTVTLKVISCWGTGTQARSAYISINNTGINELSSSSRLSVYPNPAKGLFEINLNQPAGTNTVLRIMDLNGKVVYQRENISEKEIIDMTNASKGIYILNISGSVNATKKLIVE